MLCFKRALYLAPILVGGTAQMAASPFAYATNYVQDLYRIDLNSSASQFIGNIGFAAQGLALTTSGRLFATNSTGKLFDVTGAVVTPIMNLGALQIGSMDAQGNNLWGFDNTSNKLFEFDTVSMTFVQWSSAITLPSPVNALTIDSSGNFLAMIGSGTSNKMIKIQNGTWAASVINPNPGLTDLCEAMNFLSDGNLYAAVLGDWRYELDPTTGAVINGFYSGIHRDWADMTTDRHNVTPEPLSLAGLSLFGLALRRRKNQS
ncbi:MAG: hypothetical protein JSS72_09700 [Armatimonadetes bacterium]|nr:hypothetical protein [Armatimonadota bacterium]